MRLAEFGIIRIDGRTERHDPGASFGEYQRLLASYKISRTIRDRMNRNGEKELGHNEGRANAALVAQR